MNSEVIDVTVSAINKDIVHFTYKTTKKCILSPHSYIYELMNDIEIPLTSILHIVWTEPETQYVRVIQKTTQLSDLHLEVNSVLQAIITHSNIVSPFAGGYDQTSCIFSEFRRDHFSEDNPFLVAFHPTLPYVIYSDFMTNFHVCSYALEWIHTIDLEPRNIQYNAADNNSAAIFPINVGLPTKMIVTSTGKLFISFVNKNNKCLFAIYDVSDQNIQSWRQIFHWQREEMLDWDVSLDGSVFFEQYTKDHSWNVYDMAKALQHFDMYVSVITRVGDWDWANNDHEDVGKLALSKDRNFVYSSEASSQLLYKIQKTESFVITKLASSIDYESCSCRKTIIYKNKVFALLTLAEETTAMFFINVYNIDTGSCVYSLPFENPPSVPTNIEISDDAHTLFIYFMNRRCVTVDVSDTKVVSPKVFSTSENSKHYSTYVYHPRMTRFIGVNDTTDATFCICTILPAFDPEYHPHVYELSQPAEGGRRQKTATILNGTLCSTDPTYFFSLSSSGIAPMVDALQIRYNLSHSYNFISSCNSMSIFINNGFMNRVIDGNDQFLIKSYAYLCSLSKKQLSALYYYTSTDKQAIDILLLQSYRDMQLINPKLHDILQTLNIIFANAPLSEVEFTVYHANVFTDSTDGTYHVASLHMSDAIKYGSFETVSCFGKYLRGCLHATRVSVGSKCLFLPAKYPGVNEYDGGDLIMFAPNLGFTKTESEHDHQGYLCITKVYMSHHSSVRNPSATTTTTTTTVESVLYTTDDIDAVYQLYPKYSGVFRDFPPSVTAEGPSLLIPFDQKAEFLSLYPELAEESAMLLDVTVPIGSILRRPLKNGFSYVVYNVDNEKQVEIVAGETDDRRLLRVRPGDKVVIVPVRYTFYTRERTAKVRIPVVLDLDKFDTLFTRSRTNMRKYILDGNMDRVFQGDRHIFSQHFNYLCSLSVKQLKAIYYYATGPGSRDMNLVLSGLKEKNTLDQAVQEYMNDLIHIIRNAPVLSTCIVVYRGYKYTDKTDNIFTSTSISAQVAKEFIERETPDNIISHRRETLKCCLNTICVFPNAKFLYIPSMFPGASIYDEDEILFGPNLGRTIKLSESTVDDYANINAVYVPYLAHTEGEREALPTLEALEADLLSLPCSPLELHRKNAELHEGHSVNDIDSLFGLHPSLEEEKEESSNEVATIDHSVATQEQRDIFPALQKSGAVLVTIPSIPVAGVGKKRLIPGYHYVLYDTNNEEKENILITQRTDSTLWIRHGETLIAYPRQRGEKRKRDEEEHAISHFGSFSTKYSSKKPTVTKKTKILKYLYAIFEVVKRKEKQRT